MWRRFVYRCPPLRLYADSHLGCCPKETTCCGTACCTTGFACIRAGECQSTNPVTSSTSRVRTATSTQYTSSASATIKNDENNAPNKAVVIGSAVGGTIIFIVIAGGGGWYIFDQLQKPPKERWRAPWGSTSSGLTGGAPGSSSTGQGNTDGLAAQKNDGTPSSPSNGTDHNQPVSQ
jgi:hypothetical protein